MTRNEPAEDAGAIATTTARGIASDTQRVGLTANAANASEAPISAEDLATAAELFGLRHAQEAPTGEGEREAASGFAHARADATIETDTPPSTEANAPAPKATTTRETSGKEGGELAATSASLGHSSGATTASLATTSEATGITNATNATTTTGGTARRGGHGRAHPVKFKGCCLVDNCENPRKQMLQRARMYLTCAEHARAKMVMFKDEECRECQACRTFHPLSEFDGLNKTCETRLSRKKMRYRARTQSGAVSGGTVGSGGMPPLSGAGSVGAGGGGNAAKRPRVGGYNDGDHTATTPGAALAESPLYWPPYGGAPGGLGTFPGSGPPVSSDAAWIIAEASAEAFRAAVQRSVANAMGAGAGAGGGGGAAPGSVGGGNGLPGGAQAMGALPGGVHGLPCILGGAPATDALAGIPGGAHGSAVMNLEWMRVNQLLGMAQQFQAQQGAEGSNGVFPPAPPGPDVGSGGNGSAGAPGCCVM